VETQDLTVEDKHEPVDDEDTSIETDGDLRLHRSPLPRSPAPI